MIKNNRISFEDWCIKNKKQTLLNQWNIERNGELSPKDVSFGSDKLVWWKDSLGNEWQARISSRTSNKSRGLSPFIDGKLPIIGVNDLATTHPEIAKEFHPTLNGVLTPSMIKAGSNKSVWWICPKDHIHRASPWTRTQGHKCPYCTGRKVLVGYNDLSTTHPEIARTFHPTFNGDVIVSMISAGMNSKYWWLCSNNHSYQSNPCQRAHNKGCPFCAGKKLLKGFNDLQTRNPKVAMEWHPTKNGDLKPDQVFPFTNRKAWWKCDHNHEWEATINSRQQNGCPECYKALRTSLREKTVFYYIHKYFPTSISNYKFVMIHEVRLISMFLKQKLVSNMTVSFITKTLKEIFVKMIRLIITESILFDYVNQCFLFYLLKILLSTFNSRIYRIKNLKTLLKRFYQSFQRNWIKH